MSGATSNDDQPFPLPEMDANGVDLSQIRRMLALSPAERLQQLESAVASMMVVRGESPPIPRDPDSAR